MTHQFGFDFLSIDDGRLASDFRDLLDREGWVADWARLADGRWEARIGGSMLPGAVVGLGWSRTSALSAAHLAAIRRISPGLGSLFQLHLVSLEDTAGVESIS